MVDLFILAAEPSADRLGAELIKELLSKRPHLHIAALAGPHMRKLPIDVVDSMEKLQVMGFFDVLLALPRICRHFFRLRDTLLKLNPKAIVCIDYPGFNLRLEKSLRKKGYKGKLIHYICPTVWAWGKKRIKVMEKTLDLLLTIFPFEKGCFLSSPLSIEYVGHPLTQTIGQHKSSLHFRDTYSLRGPILALFPGSRKEEIERNLPLQIKAAKKLLELNPELQIAISVCSADREAQVWSLSGLKATCIPAQDTYDLMNHSHLAIATSGTVTLELSLHKVPTIVTYFVKPIDLFFAQKIFRINLPFYCIVNIIAQKEVYPELIGPNLTLEKLLQASTQMLQDSEKRAHCIEQCKQIQNELGQEPASLLAAEKILEIL